MTDEPRNQPDSASRPHAYEPPLVEDITPDDDGPVVTAPGTIKTPPTDF
jgi:hypothetical protein